MGQERISPGWAVHRVKVLVESKTTAWDCAEARNQLPQAQNDYVGAYDLALGSLQERKENHGSHGPSEDVACGLVAKRGGG